MNCKIALVGESWGAEEEAQRVPFVGAAGWCLNQMLDEAGIHRADCFLTNIINQYLPGKDITKYCDDKKGDVLIDLGSLKPSAYLRREFLPELVRLQDELNAVKPNVIIALGGTAAWYFTGSPAISRTRGTITSSGGRWVLGKKVLPTWHPKDVLADWSLRPVTVLDLAKAFRESLFPEIRRPERTVYIEPSLEDLEWYFEKFIAPATALSFDIETSGDQITCIGFGPGKTTALVVPFRDLRQTSGDHVGSYWPTKEAEMVAWRFVRRVLGLPMPKYGQNTLYDINFLWTRYGIPVVNYADDTMLLHHALQPESLKGLGFLGSVYSNESSWKLMNRRDPTSKREK